MICCVHAYIRSACSAPSDVLVVFVARRTAFYVLAVFAARIAVFFWFGTRMQSGASGRAARALLSR